VDTAELHLSLIEYESNYIVQKLLSFCQQNRNLGVVMWREMNNVLHHIIVYSGSE
jgi:hypothetical protein